MTFEISASARFEPTVVWAILLAAVIFTAAPWLDLAASRVFFSDERGFWMAQERWLLDLREVLWIACVTPLWLALAALIGVAAGRLRCAVPARIWGFVVSIYLLGPCLLANVLLKGHWGRARPANILEFGGTAQFTPALLPAQECVRNCSFVSGEGSAAAALLISGLVLSCYVRSPSRRVLLRCTLWAIALTGMGLRVMMGRHFLSDTLFAGLFVAAIALALMRIIGAVRAPRRAFAPVRA